MGIKGVMREVMAWSQMQLGEFAAGLSPIERERVSTPTAWNAKDHLAHVTYWIISAAERTRKARLGEAVEEVIDIDRENDRIYHLYRDRTWDEILEELDAGFSAAWVIVDSLSEEELTDPGAASWVGDRSLCVRLLGNMVLHPISHVTAYYKGHQKSREFARRFQEQALPKLQQVEASEYWHGTLLYDAACYWALAGGVEQAIGLLARSLELAPNLRDYARLDGDLGSLRDEPGFLTLFAD